MDYHVSSCLEKRFSSLLFADKLLLWSVRLWADALNRGCGVSELLRDAYRLAGAGDAYLDLDGLMSIVATSASTSIDVRCTKCATVSLDEQAFIRAVAVYQAGFPLFDASEIFAPGCLRQRDGLSSQTSQNWAVNFNMLGFGSAAKPGPDRYLVSMLAW